MSTLPKSHHNHHTHCTLNILTPLHSYLPDFWGGFKYNCFYCFSMNKAFIPVASLRILFYFLHLNVIYLPVGFFKFNLSDGWWDLWIYGLVSNINLTEVSPSLLPQEFLLFFFLFLFVMFPYVYVKPFAVFPQVLNVPVFSILFYIISCLLFSFGSLY